MPAGVIAIVFGVLSEVSAYSIASPVIRKISFTGLGAVGKELMKLAAEGAKRATMGSLAGTHRCWCSTTSMLTMSSIFRSRREPL